MDSEWISLMTKTLLPKECVTTKDRWRWSPKRRLIRTMTTRGISGKNAQYEATHRRGKVQPSSIYSHKQSADSKCTRHELSNTVHCTSTNGSVITPSEPEMKHLLWTVSERCSSEGCGATATVYIPQDIILKIKFSVFIRLDRVAYVHVFHSFYFLNCFSSVILSIRGEEKMANALWNSTYGMKIA